MFTKFGVLPFAFVTEAMLVPVESFLKLILCESNVCSRFFIAVARSHGCFVYYGFCEAFPV